MQTNMATQHHFVMPERRFLHPRALLAGLLMVPTYAYYVSVFYPGYYTADSLYMLQMGLGSAPISNWHPPLLSLLWGRIYTFFGGPHALWLVQLTLFFAAIGYLSSLYRNAVISVIAIVVLTWWPPLMTNMGAVWKDNWAIIAMIATVALTKAAWADRHRGLAMLALVMATVSATFRVDYIVVVFPLVLSLGWRFRGVPGAASFGAVALAMICGLLFAQSYFVTKRLNPWVAIAAWDIAGTIAQSSDASSGVVMNGQTFSPDQLRGLYSCRTPDPAIFGNGGLPVNLPEGPLIRDTGDEAREIGRLWLETVTGHLAGYVSHRWCVIREFLGFGSDVKFPYPFGVAPNNLGIDFQRSLTNIAIYWFFDAHSNGAMWRLWIYLVVTALSVGAIILADRDKMLPLAIGLTVVIAASRVAILPGPDFRYGLWIVAGTWLVALEAMDRIATAALAGRRAPP